MENGIVPRQELENHSIPAYAPKKTFIEETFETYPLLRHIAYCESGQGSGQPYRQFEADGTPFKSRLGTPDYGIMQISLTYHKKESERLGYDVLHSADDNVAYGLYLYKKYGTAPWNASKGCWGIRQ